jgi:hypothetical protein
MSDKKHLNFDFLDEGTKSAEAVSIPKSTPSTTSSGSEAKISFIEYFRHYFTDFPKFAEKHLTVSKPRYLLLVIWAVGVGTVMDRIIGSNTDYSTWGEGWAIALFGGILSGALAYYIAGWFYNVRVKWSKGRDSIDTSRHIYIFATLPIAITTVLSFIFNQMAYGEDYFNSYDATSVDMVFFFVFLAALFISIRMGYKAAREVLGASKGRAIGWFIIAPAIFYTVLIFFSAIASS